MTTPYQEKLQKQYVYMKERRKMADIRQRYYSDKSLQRAVHHNIYRFPDEKDDDFYARMVHAGIGRQIIKDLGYGYYGISVISNKKYFAFMVILRGDVTGPPWQDFEDDRWLGEKLCHQIFGSRQEALVWCQSIMTQNDGAPKFFTYNAGYAARYYKETFAKSTRFKKTEKPTGFIWRHHISWYGDRYEAIERTPILRETEKYVYVANRRRKNRGLAAESINGNDRDDYIRLSKEALLHKDGAHTSHDYCDDYYRECPKDISNWIVDEDNPHYFMPPEYSEYFEPDASPITPETPDDEITQIKNSIAKIRSLMQKAHPDKGGDAKEFMDLKRQHNALKRKLKTMTN